MPRVILIGLACFLALSARMRAEQMKAAEEEPIPVFHVSSNFVLVDASVIEHKTGKQIGNLSAQDFRLEEDGTLQSIRYFSHDQLPLSIVLMFDVTGTVQPELKKLASDALKSLTYLKPEDEVAVMTFSSTAQMVQPFTRDHSVLVSAIHQAAQVKSGEATFLDEDLYEGSNSALKATIPNSRRVLILFTDGTSDYVNPLTRKVSKSAIGQLHTRDQALRQLQQGEVSVSAIIDRSSLKGAVMEAAAADPFSFLFGMNPKMDEVQRYANETGGYVLHGNGQQIADEFTTLIEEIRGRYTMGYVPNKAQPAGTFCRINLRLAPEALANHPDLQHDHYDIRYRKGYYR